MGEVIWKDATQGTCNAQQKTMLPFLSAKSILSLKKLFRGSLQYRQTKLLKGIIGEVLHLEIVL